MGVSLVNLYRPKITLSMRVGYVIPPTQLIWHTRHTDLYTYIYISREISIEHPSVGLASLAQSDIQFIATGRVAPETGYKYIYYIGAWNGPIKLVRRGGIYFDVPPQCSTPDTAHGQWVRRYGYSSSS